MSIIAPPDLGPFGDRSGVRLEFAVPACVVFFSAVPESPHPCASARIKQVAESVTVLVMNFTMSVPRAS